MSIRPLGTESYPTFRVFEEVIESGTVGSENPALDPGTFFKNLENEEENLPFGRDPIRYDPSSTRHRETGQSAQKKRKLETNNTMNLDSPPPNDWESKKRAFSRISRHTQEDIFQHMEEAKENRDYQRGRYLLRQAVAEKIASEKLFVSFFHFGNRSDIIDSFETAKEEGMASTDLYTVFIKFAEKERLYDLGAKAFVEAINKEMASKEVFPFALKYAYKTGETDKAKQLFELAQEQTAEGEDKLSDEFLMRYLSYNDFNLAEASKAFELLCQKKETLNTKKIDIYFNLLDKAKNCSKTKDILSEAKKAYNFAHENGLANDGIVNRHLDLCYWIKDIGEASRVLTHQSVISQPNASNHFHLAIELENFDEAHRVCSRLLENPQLNFFTPFTLYKYLFLACEKERFSGVEDIFNRARDLFKINDRCYRTMIDIFCRAEELDKMVALFKDSPFEIPKKQEGRTYILDFTNMRTGIVCAALEIYLRNLNESGKEISFRIETHRNQDEKRDFPIRQKIESFMAKHHKDISCTRTSYDESVLWISKPN